jgi:hypothetical protein
LALIASLRHPSITSIAVDDQAPTFHRLVCLGYGVYGRAVTSQLSGKPILYSPNGFADQFLGAIERGLNIGIWHGAAFGGQQNLGERDVCARFEPVDRITTADFLALEWRLWWRR